MITIFRLLFTAVVYTRLLPVLVNPILFVRQNTYFLLEGDIEDKEVSIDDMQLKIV